MLPGPTRSEGVERFVQDLAKTQGTDEASVEKEFFRSVSPSSLLNPFATPEGVAALVGVQPPGLGHQRGGPAGRWRRGPAHRVRGRTALSQAKGGIDDTCTDQSA